MDEAVISAFDDAQRRGLALLKDVFEQLSPGVSEAALSDAARDLAPRHGFDRWFHPPEILIGARTSSNAVWKTPRRDVQLATGQMVSVVLGPAGADAYAEVGATRAFGIPDPPVLQVTRECVRATAGFCSQWKTVGELYIYARAWAVNHRMRLVNERSIGHALLPGEGLLKTGFPQSVHTATWMRRYQIRRLNPTRVSGIWAVRPQIADGDAAAWFSEVVFVNGPDKRILGRSGISEIGSL